MSFPDFYELAPRIRLHDPLAAFLGACDDGIIEYHYVDAVRLAGHSCPTVAGAFLMARTAVAVLYPQETAERGGITIQMPAPVDEGTTGVIAQVLTLVTGAAANNGFKGIAGRFARNNLLDYAAIDSSPEAVVFRRADTGVTVTVELDTGPVPVDASLPELIGPAMQGTATAGQLAEFRRAWQARVRRLLLEHAHDPRVLKVTKH